MIETIDKSALRLWDGTHSNLVHVYKSFFKIPSPLNDYAIDMEFCPYNLEEYLGKVMGKRSRECPNHYLDLSDIVSIMVQVGEGIKYIHGRDVVHGKIKPKNGTYPMGETS